MAWMSRSAIELAGGEWRLAARWIGPGCRLRNWERIGSGFRAPGGEWRRRVSVVHCASSRHRSAHSIHLSAAGGELSHTSTDRVVQPAPGCRGRRPLPLPVARVVPNWEREAVRLRLPSMDIHKISTGVPSRLEKNKMEKLDSVCLADLRVVYGWRGNYRGGGGIIWAGGISDWICAAGGLVGCIRFDGPRSSRRNFASGGCGFGRGTGYRSRRLRRSWGFRWRR